MRTLIFVYVVFLHLLIGFMIMNTDFIDRVKAKLGRPVENASVSYYMDSLYYFQRLKHNQMQDNGQNFLLGDSIAQGLNENNLRQKVVNWGIGHNTTERLNNELANLSKPLKAKNVFLIIGINDIFQQVHTKKMIENIKGILEHLNYIDKITLVSALPLGENKKKLNQSVKKFNNALQALSEDNKKVHFLNIYPHFIDDLGFLKSEYDRGDGLHINEQGYALMASLLNKGFYCEQ